MGIIARFLPSLVPGLGALANPWVLLGILAAAAACFAAGVKVEAWHRDSADLAQEKSYAEALKLFHAKQRQNNDGISADLNKERAGRAEDQTNWRAWYDRNKDNLFTVISAPSSSSDPTAAGSARPDPGGASPPARVSPDAGVRIMCGPECVSGWHRALAQGLPAAYRTWGAYADSGAPDSVEASAVIANAAENFAACNAVRGRLLAFQAWARLNNLTNIEAPK